MKKEAIEKELLKEFAQMFRNHYVEIIKDLRAAHEKHEKGLISKEAFERYEKSCDHLLEVVETAEYRILHGPRKEFSRLIRIRKEKGLTQAEVAKKAGISLSQYALLEQGFGEKISKKQKEKVARALNVPYEELFRVTAWWGKKIPEEIKKILGT